LWHRAWGAAWPGSPEAPFSGSFSAFSKVFGRTATDLWMTDGVNLRHWNGAVLSCTSCFELDNVNAMWGAATNDWFLVGNFGSIRHWNGSTWTAMTSGTTQSLQAIWGTSATNIYAAGADGTLLHYDGTSWSKVPLSTNATFDAIIGSVADDVFVAGASGVMFHYDGEFWSPVRTEATTNIRALARGGSVLFATEQNGGRLHRLVRATAW
jgi:hypothetical protein